MDPDQSQQSQDLQMCIAPDAAAAQTSTPADAPGAPAPGPLSGGDNPLLAGVSGVSGSASVASSTATLPDGTGGSLWDVGSLGPSMAGDQGAAGTGLLGGIKDAGVGISELWNGKWGAGAADLGKGLLETGSGAIGLAGPEATSLLGKAGGALGGAAGIVSGVQDLITGVGDASSNDSKTATTGGLEIAKGDLETVGGGFSLFGALGGGSLGLMGDAGAALAAGGAGAASVIGSVLAAGAAGIGAGIGMEKASTSSGLFTEDGAVGPDGKPINESGAEKTADWGSAVANWIDPARKNDDGSFHAGGGSGEGLLDGNFSADGARTTLANTAGIATTLGSLPAAVGMDLAGTAVTGYNWLKNVL